MVDDGTYARCIFGVGKTKENLHLCIGDPHIRTNNKNQLSHIGIYVVTLDK